MPRPLTQAQIDHYRDEGYAANAERCEVRDGSADLEKLYRSEVARWRKVSKGAGVKIE